MTDRPISPALRSALESLISETESMMFYAEHAHDSAHEDGAVDEHALLDIEESSKLLQAAVARVKNAAAAESKRRPIAVSLVADSEP